MSVFEPRIAAALPRSSEAFHEIVEMQTRRNSVTALLAKTTILERNVTWVKENGLCVDLIRADKSTIKQAGMGAFAQGNIMFGHRQ